MRVAGGRAVEQGGRAGIAATAANEAAEEGGVAASRCVAVASAMLPGCVGGPHARRGL